MARTPEAQFSEKFIKQINKIPGCYLEKISDSFKVGLPDIIGSLFGRAAAFEIKVTEKIIDGRPLLSGHTFSDKQKNVLMNSKPARKQAYLTDYRYLHLAPLSIDIGKARASAPAICSRFLHRSHKSHSAQTGTVR